MSTKLKVESKKLKVTLFYPLFCTFYLLVSCGGDEKTNAELPQNDSTQIQVIANTGEAEIIEPIVDEKIVELENNGIKLTEIKAEPSEAVLTLNTKSFNEGKNQLQFAVSGVDNYTISYLANNYTLTQFSSDVFEVEYLYGNNVFLAFLTDKNNISIKTNKGCVLRNVVLGAGMESLFDMNQPHLFYYMPQQHTDVPILDFYLVNTTIAEGGNKVKVTINGTEFLISKWAAYQITGLTKPDNTIRIQLIDKKGKLIEGPFNDSGERSFQIVNKAS